MIKKIFTLLCLCTLCIGSAWGDSWTRVTTIKELTDGGTFIMGYEETAKSGEIIPLRSADCNATTSANGYFHTGVTVEAISNSKPINMGTVTETEDYEIYVTASSTDGYINIQMKNAEGNFYGATSGGTTSNKGRLYTSGNSTETNIKPEWANETNNQFKLTSAVSGGYKYLKYNTGSPRFAFYNTEGSNIVFYKKQTGPIKLSVPTGLQSANVTQTSAVLSWTDDANASSYTLAYKKESDTGFTETTFANGSTFSGLSSGTEYTWKVKAVGDETNFSTSEYSETSKFKTLSDVNYTVIYMVNGVSKASQVNVPGGTPLEFPAVSAPDADHVFCGWVTEAITGTADSEPTYVNTTGLTATQTITYYAVFAEQSGDGPAEQKTQTLQYDTWTCYGSTTNKDTYRLFHSGSYIESAEFDLSKLSKVIVYGGSFGGGSNNSLTIGDGTNTWKSVTVSGSSQTGTNTYTDGTPLSGTGKLRVTSNSGSASGSGVRISKVEIFTMEGDYTYSNWCTTVVTKQLTSISISGEYPTEFWKGDTFSNEGMVVTAHYDDSSSKDVTNNATFSGYDMNTASDQTVTITYDTKSTTYGIKVKSIANTPETAYTVAQAIELIDAGNDLGTEVYVKGTVSKIVTAFDSKYGNISFDVSADGQKTGDQFQFFRNFKGADETWWASAEECPAVGDDVIGYGTMKKFNSTYEFNEGNYIVSTIKASNLSIDNITVEIDGDITPVIETNVVGEYTISYTSDNEEVVLADGDEMVTMGLGIATITATLSADGYKEATTTFSVEVIKALTGIAVKTAPANTSYKADDKFDPTGLVITATYSDASTGDIEYAGNEDKFTFNPSLETALTTENTSITITYAGKTTTQEITVRALITYDITWMANGEEHAATQVTEGDALVLPETNPAKVGDMVFQGWINTDNYYDAETAPEYIVPSEIIPTEAMTFYAVFAKEVEVEGPKTYSLLPTDFETGSYSANDGDKEINGVTLTIKDVYQNSSSIQMKASSGSLYNKYALGKKITSVVVSVKTNSVKVYEGSANNSWEEVTGSNGTYTFSDNKAYLKVTSTGKYAQVNSITVNYIGKTTSYSNYCTRFANVEISEAGWATACLPFNATITSNNATAYYVTTSGSTLNKVEAKVIPANEGVLLKSNEGGAATVTFTESALATDDDENYMLGSVAGETFIDPDFKYYILANDETRGLGFYWQKGTAGTSVVCAAGKAVLAVPSNNAKAFFSLGDEPSGIKDVQSYSLKVQGSVYNLNGVRVNENYNGIVIMNGKKYINK